MGCFLSAGTHCNRPFLRASRSSLSPPPQRIAPAFFAWEESHLIQVSPSSHLVICGQNRAVTHTRISAEINPIACFSRPLRLMYLSLWIVLRRPNHTVPRGIWRYSGEDRALFLSEKTRTPCHELLNRLSCNFFILLPTCSAGFREKEGRTRRTDFRIYGTSSFPGRAAFVNLQHSALRESAMIELCREEMG